MSQSYINSIDVSDLILQGPGTSYNAVTGTSYLDFSGVTTNELSENYFNISPRLSNAIYNNLVEKLTTCANIITPVDNYESMLASDVNSGYYNYYKYSNSVYSSKAETDFYSNVDNKYLLKFEDIVCKDENNSNLSLDPDTNISSFIKSISSNSTDFTTLSAFNGAFFYVDLDTMSQVATDENSMLIQAGESIEIPVTFEYFIDKDSFDRSSIKKTLIFAIKDSLYRDENYYEVEIAGNTSSLNTNSIYTESNNIDLSNELDGDLL